jgi:hypothetical protein
LERFLHRRVTSLIFAIKTQEVPEQSDHLAQMAQPAITRSRPVETGKEKFRLKELARADAFNGTL